MRGFFLEKLSFLVFFGKQGRIQEEFLHGKGLPRECPRNVTLQGWVGIRHSLMILGSFSNLSDSGIPENKGFLPPGTAPARTGTGMLEQDFIPHFLGSSDYNFAFAHRVP